MKKIPTLFKREFEDHKIVKCTSEVTEGCEWVFNEPSIATRKWDGTCVLFKDGVLWKRYDAKRGKPIPYGAVPCQEEADAVTGHFPCWVKVTDEPCDKWFRVAYENMYAHGDMLEEGKTYELCGPHFNGNPEKFELDCFIEHGAEKIELLDRSYDAIKAYLSRTNIEGIVFYRTSKAGVNSNGEIDLTTCEKCKIKRTDFGFEWNNSTQKRNKGIK